MLMNTSAALDVQPTGEAGGKPGPAFVLDRLSDRALYLQIADRLRDTIVGGVYGPGEALPSETELLTALSVSRAAVRRAVAVLCHEGLVTAERGLPTVVRAQADLVTVVLRPGERISARMPTEPERRQRGTHVGVPLIEVIRADGTRDAFDGDRVELRTAG
jgi:DNA-binding transcriptional regulator YhcF (GntR family)